MDTKALHAEQLKTLTAARRAYDLAMAAYRAAPAGHLREAAQEAHYAAGDVVNLAQGCVYTTGAALRENGEGRALPPRRELPKTDASYASHSVLQRAQGWNECLDEIARLAGG